MSLIGTVMSRVRRKKALQNTFLTGTPKVYLSATKSFQNWLHERNEKNIDFSR